MIKIIRQNLSRVKRFLQGNNGPYMIQGYKSLKRNVQLKRTRISNSTFIDAPSYFDIEDNVYIGHHCFIEASHGVKIGTGCQLTNFITITSHSSHDAIRLNGANYKGGSDTIGYQTGSIEIGEYTFIGPYATLMPGTKIGKGSIVSAYSYVTGDFPDFSIIQGNPAKRIGDTRDRDKKYLKENPQLVEHYKSWTEISE